MNRRYTVKPIDTITLDFPNDDSITMRLDTRAMYHLSTEYDMQEMLKNPSITEICAAIIYSSSVEHMDGMTQEKAREITCQLSLDVIVGIIKDFEESLGVDIKSEQKKTMQEFLSMKLNR